MSVIPTVRPETAIRWHRQGFQGKCCNFEKGDGRPRSNCGSIGVIRTACLDNKSIGQRAAGNQRNFKYLWLVFPRQRAPGFTRVERRTAITPMPRHPCCPMVSSFFILPILPPDAFRGRTPIVGHILRKFQVDSLKPRPETLPP